MKVYDIVIQLNSWVFRFMYNYYLFEVMLVNSF